MSFRGEEGNLSSSSSSSRPLLCLATFAGSLVSSAAVALAESDVEYAELPPPYVPVIFAVVILGGVGALTGSLGDVISDEASLGNLSGAKAKKEMERGRSSYFKNKK
eukprot:CAMPEP_0195529306 /NCGR_PEP_ID=MMETSP0794_2-20130614/31793_1 /TAXON_ID=515487 /ORGANISM="Stephanopyxis turris, Strain CCMP 815" /LENGTH=106 /DNA_ID=CAMNT_0040660595 /DNA_START=282 /DNA_END=602 /DNA_ORIENTATION=-